MTDGIISFTVRGLKARVLKLIVGTPFLLVGVVLVGAGLTASDIARVVLLAIGSVLGFVGCAAYYGAVRSDEFTVTLGDGSGQQDGGA
ncbi:hypothetical protein [Halorussus litoreus]|uniref:hypothetical protein n=1 Tax=Halorussus litoreus TaxID=1710536 RepID=UPI000E2689B9|nr:hypothetical protein [Halorussus litoreus]